MLVDARGDRRARSGAAGRAGRHPEQHRFAVEPPGFGVRSVQARIRAREGGSQLGHPGGFRARIHPGKISDDADSAREYRLEGRRRWLLDRTGAGISTPTSWRARRPACGRRTRKRHQICTPRCTTCPARATGICGQRALGSKSRRSLTGASASRPPARLWRAVLASDTGRRRTWVIRAPGRSDRPSAASQASTATIGASNGTCARRVEDGVPVLGHARLAARAAWVRPTDRHHLRGGGTGSGCQRSRPACPTPLPRRGPRVAVDHDCAMRSARARHL
jgi:hypothetical protein